MLNFNELNDRTLLIAGLIYNKLVNENNKTFSHMKLHKMLYIVYGVYLVLYSESVCASPRYWPMGPVFPRLYRQLRKQQNRTQETALLMNYFDNYESLKDEKKIDTQTATQIEKVVNSVVKSFGGFTASALSDWSHEPNSPWARMNDEIGDSWNEIISNDYIKEYFEKNVVKNSQV